MTWVIATGTLHDAEALIGESKYFWNRDITVGNGPKLLQGIVKGLVNGVLDFLKCNGAHLLRIDFLKLL